MKRPVIGLTPQYDAKNDHTWMRPQYHESLRKAGALSVLLLQYTDPADTFELLDDLDGILFTGGGDLDPARYGEAKEPECGEPTLVRDAFEFPLYAECVRRGMPILGICRGIQLMNVAAGGTLWQHKPAHHAVNHPITVKKDSLFYSIFGKEEIMVNSYHHQAVKDVAPRYRACCYSHVPESGKLIEAIYAPDAPYFDAGVQFHPENMYDESEDARKIFAAFVDACKRYAADKK